MLVAVVGTLVYNFPTTLTLLARNTFHGGAGLAGLLMGILGIGTVMGALVAAHRCAAHLADRRQVRGRCSASRWSSPPRSRRRSRSRSRSVPVGAMAVFFGSTSNAHMQVWSDSASADG